MVFVLLGQVEGCKAVLFILFRAIDFSDKGLDQLSSEDSYVFWMGDVFMKLIEAHLTKGLREVEVIMKSGEELPDS